MKQENQTKNPWAVEDEKSHPSRSIEWWSFIGFFTTHDDQKQWNVKATLSDGLMEGKNVDALCNVVLFDQSSKQHHVFLKRLQGVPLDSNKDRFEVRHGESWMKGCYPCYEVHIKDSHNDIVMDFLLHAESLPHWVAQDASDGWLPMGLGCFRYGFIPKVQVSGTIKIAGVVHSLSGVGYFEHVWGDFVFRNPLLIRRNASKAISTYMKLGLWWLQGRRQKTPSKLMVCSENNPFGYDWAWAVLSNGWTVFYGNSLFCLMQGPAAGILILSKDGKTFTEFNDIMFRYTKTADAKSFDFVYPAEFELTARKADETLQLKFSMTEESREYVSGFSKVGFWRAFVVCESSGVVTGLYTNKEEEILLQGTAKIEPQRQVSVLGHNFFSVELIKPPSGVGVAVELDSHFFGKKIKLLLRLFPKPLFHWVFWKTKKDT